MDINNQSTHRVRGDELVARASFGTQFGVSIMVGIAVLFIDPEPIYFVVLFFALFGSSLGYMLWRNGHKEMATILGTGGLLCAGIISHLLLGTVGGPTGILLLGSVITAGGLGGRIEATITSIIVMVAIFLGYVFFPPSEVVLDFVGRTGLIGLKPSILPLNANLIVPEIIMLAFVGFSVPCWGAYVVALDTSNRRARSKAEAALEERALLAARIQRDQQLESLVKVSGEVAHDFNNTLMVISGSIDILEHHRDFPKELIHNLQMMRNATKISAGLTNKLLNFVRVRQHHWFKSIRFTPSKNYSRCWNLRSNRRGNSNFLFQLHRTERSNFPVVNWNK
jgi:hypothetical protein